MNTRKIATVVGTTAAAAAVVALAAGADAATATHKIVAGKTASGTTSYTGKTTANPGITFKDGGVTLHCTSGSAAGTLKLGAKVANAGIATIGKTSFVGCKGPGGIPLTVKQSGVWHLNIGGATSGSGVTPGNISGVKATVSGPSGCKFVVAGAVTGSYQNGSHRLVVNSKTTGTKRLTVTSGSCLGVVKKGQHPTFAASYLIGTPKGAVKVTNK